MGNKIVYGDFTFTDNDIISAQVTLSNAMVSESLSADEFKFTVYSHDNGVMSHILTVDLEDYMTVDNEYYVVREKGLQDYVYGTPLFYYKDEVLQGKYYISNVVRTGRYTFDFNCISAVGLLIKINHAGGVYVNSTTSVGQLIRGIFSKIGLTENTDYIIDNAVDSVPVNGWLPYATCRDNLRQILFAVGASIVKEVSGKISIKYISSPTLKNIPDERIYLGGNVNFLTPASAVEVWEHDYHAVATDQMKLLFDNTTEGNAVNELITFEKPMHPDITTGQWVITGTLTVSEIGANYAIVNGIGTLSGYEYSHTTRVLTETLLNNGQKNIITVKDATLVSSVNSKNVTKRVAAYYGQAKEIACDIVMADDDLKPSSRVAFTDPFGEATTGYIKSMNIGVSKTDKASSVISTDWTPSHFGNNYENSLLLTTGTSWTATFTGDCRIVLIGGGQGGQGGYNGANGTNGEAEARVGRPSPVSKYCADGGLGGNGGTGGNGGKVYILDISVTQGTTYNISIGAGGQGGSSNGGTGSNGTPSTITINGTTYTSENGLINNNGHVNVLTGDVYATLGWNGGKGGDGLKNVSLLQNYTENVDIQISNDEYHRFTYTSGNRSTTDEVYVGIRCGAFGSVGGAGSLGNNGTNATEPYKIQDDLYSRAGNGGNGGNAISLEEFEDSSLNDFGFVYSVQVGQGGVGGNGGGGGAGGGNSWYHQYIEGTGVPGTGGTGGTGSVGCTGGQGGILIYY